MSEQTHLEIVRALTQGMTVEAIGNILGITKSAASKKLKGKRSLTIDDRKRIIEYFSLDEETAMRLMLH